MFQSILVATDGSAHAENAVRLATDIAQRYAAKLTIIHVITDWDIPHELREMIEVEHVLAPPGLDLPPSGLLSFERLNPEQRYQTALALSEKILERAGSAAQAAGLRQVETVSLEGDAAEVIIDQLRSSEVDLLVVGTRGLGRLGGLVLGSVSHKVSMLAPCACLIAR
ncbi:MAG: universal stress protein [Pseudomonadota bacterium]